MQYPVGEEGKDLDFFARTLRHFFSTAVVWGDFAECLWSWFPTHVAGVSHAVDETNDIICTNGMKHFVL